MTATRKIETPDGRWLCLEVAGEPGGDVIVYHNGSPNSRLLYAPMVADAVTRGARLVGYDRPGYGGSSRRPGRSVADAADDLRAIAAALGVDRLVTWGMSGGGPHALACAALAPDLVAATASLASVAPYDAPGLDYFDGMGDANAEGFRSHAADDPEAKAAKSAAEAEILLKATPDDLLRQWASILSPVDCAAVSEDLAAYMIDCLQAGLGPGPEGWIDDGRAFVQPWGFDPADITVPTLLWQGRQDRMVPFGHGCWLAGRIPGVDARLSDTDGHLTLVRRIPDVHDWLLTRLRAA
jgi:pimeloyl-ACP methyl ester carboxylesterase